jgi:predicted alpha/beta-hydrolase family hydrolase
MPGTLPEMRIRRTLTGPWLVAATVLLLSACRTGTAAGPISTAPSSSDVIGFRTADGVLLSGRLFGPRDSRVGIVLAHGATVNQSSWFAFADELGRRGYLVLTFDFRGYCPGGDAGCSHGTKDADGAPTDLNAAIAQIRSLGATQLGVMGSSMGGATALAVAADMGSSLDLVIALSAPPGIGSISIDDGVLSKITAPKLFVAGTQDDGSASFAQAFYDGSAQPKRLVLLDTNDHGAEMLRGTQREMARRAVFDWLGRYLPA